MFFLENISKGYFEYKTIIIKRNADKLDIREASEAPNILYEEINLTLSKK